MYCMDHFTLCRRGPGNFCRCWGMLYNESFSRILIVVNIISNNFTLNFIFLKFKLSFLLIIFVDAINLLRDSGSRIGSKTLAKESGTTPMPYRLQ